MLTDGTAKPKSWTETFKGSLFESCGVVLTTALFLPHAPLWVVVCWALCSITLAMALALARKRNQPENYATVSRLVTGVLIVMTFVFLVSLN